MSARFVLEVYDQARLRLGQSHRQVAARAGLHPASLYQFRHGRGLPSAPSLLSLAKVLGLRPNQLLRVEVHPLRTLKARPVGLEALGLTKKTWLSRSKNLTPNERLVVERRFALNGHPQSKLAAIGADLGLSRQRVAQIEKAALKKLRSQT